MSEILFEDTDWPDGAAVAGMGATHAKAFDWCCAHFDLNFPRILNVQGHK